MRTFASGTHTTVRERRTFHSRSERGLDARQCILKYKELALMTKQLSVMLGTGLAHASKKRCALTRFLQAKAMMRGIEENVRVWLSAANFGIVATDYVAGKVGKQVGVCARLDFDWLVPTHSSGACFQLQPN